MHNIVTRVNNTVLHTWKLVREYISNVLTIKKKKDTELCGIMEIPATSQGYGSNHTATYKGIKSTFHTLNLHSVMCNVNPISGKLDEIDKRSDHSRKYKSKQTIQH